MDLVQRRNGHENFIFQANSLRIHIIIMKFMPNNNVSVYTSHDYTKTLFHGRRFKVLEELISGNIAK